MSRDRRKPEARSRTMSNLSSLTDILKPINIPEIRLTGDECKPAPQCDDDSYKSDNHKSDDYKSDNDCKSTDECGDSRQSWNSDKDNDHSKDYGNSNDYGGSKD